MGILDQIKDGGAQYTSRAIDLQSLVAGSAKDNAAVTGAVIDRLNYGSAKLKALWNMNLADSETFGMKLDLQHCDTSDGTFASKEVHLTTPTALETGPSTLDTDISQKEVDVNLSGYKRYVRPVITPYFSAADTDYGVYAVEIDLLGGRTLPQTGSA